MVIPTLRGAELVIVPSAGETTRLPSLIGLRLGFSLLVKNWLREEYWWSSSSHSDLARAIERSSCEERRGAVLPVAPGGGGEHPDDDQLQRLGELGGGEPAPAPGEKSQRQQRVEEERRGGLRRHGVLRLRARALSRLLQALATGNQKCEEDESRAGQHYTDLGIEKPVSNIEYSASVVLPVSPCEDGAETQTPAKPMGWRGWRT